MLAEESLEEEVSTVASVTASPSQDKVVAFQTGVSPEQAQFGAVLPVPKQSVQDLAQLEEHSAQPSEQAPHSDPV
jgi:hypothetical protein